MGQNRPMSESREAPETAETADTTAETAAATERQRLATILDGVRAGVRQRQSELATFEEAREETRLALAELRAREVLEEPLCVSPRPVVGRLLVFARKAFFHLFGKWYARPLIEQQNRYHRAAGRLHEGLAADQERLAADHKRLAAALERLERRLDALESAPESAPEEE